MSQSLSNFFVNYQHNKLAILHPDLINLLLFLILFLAIALTVRKKNGRRSHLFSKEQTMQLRGLAIILIIFGHFWIHVASIRAEIILSGLAVSFFLVISGFGLQRSYLTRRPAFQLFCKKRIKRIMIPYWLATCLFLSLDFLILDKTYSIRNLLLTFSGINLSMELRHIDYSRWFVTFILLWYSLFLLANSLFSPKKSAIILTGTAFVLLPIHYYFFDFSWYNFFSFPAGCLLAVYYDTIAVFFAKHKKTIVYASLLWAGCLLTCITMIKNRQLYNNLFFFFPDIFSKYQDEIVYLSVTLSIFFIAGYFTEKGITSKVLTVTGKYSYELFLLHGPFLIKYNPIIKNPGTFQVTGELLFFILILLFLSFLLARTADFLQKRISAAPYS